VFPGAFFKEAMLGRTPRPEGPLFHAEEIRPHTATPEQRAVGERVLTAVPGGAHNLMYGRVDLLPTADGGDVVTEVELIEPSLYFGHRPGSAETWAGLVARAAVGAEWRGR